MCNNGTRLVKFNGMLVVSTLSSNNSRPRVPSFWPNNDRCRQHAVRVRSVGWPENLSSREPTCLRVVGGQEMRRCLPPHAMFGRKISFLAKNHGRVRILNEFPFWHT